MAWSVRSGACGTVAGQGVGASSRPSPAGRNASICATSPTSTVFSDTSANFLARNQDTHYAARRRRGEPIFTAFVESAVNQIIAKRMNKKQQMRWNGTTVQPSLDVRTAVLNNSRTPSAIAIRASGPPTMIRFCERAPDLPRILHALASTPAPAVPLRISSQLRPLDHAKTGSLSPWGSPASGIRISADRARDSLDITVPIGTCAIRAMSL
jgi:hypothetical protein